MTVAELPRVFYGLLALNIVYKEGEGRKKEDHTSNIMEIKRRGEEERLHHTTMSRTARYSIVITKIISS
jgi:hypothetical protein